MNEAWEKIINELNELGRPFSVVASGLQGDHDTGNFLAYVQRLKEAIHDGKVAME